MKFKVAFRCLDALNNDIQDMTENEQDEARELANKYVEYGEYGEYVTIKFDTVKQTAKVQRV
jgi:hypothetical protein